MPEKGLCQLFPSLWSAPVSHRNTSQKRDAFSGAGGKGRPSGSPPLRLRFDFAQKEFSWTLFPKWLHAMYFSLIICMTVQRCHYLYFMGEDTEVKKLITDLK